MDRRIPFFVVAAVLCALMGQVATPKFQGIARAAAVWYVVLAVLFLVDDVVGRHRRR